MKIWQIYFDKHSKSKLNNGFIPYNNAKKVDDFYENTVIIDIWKNKKKEWENENYVGVLSWRFFEKTSLTIEQIKKEASKKEVYLFTPPVHIFNKNPLSENGYAHVKEIAKIADKENVLPLKLYEYNNGRCVNFCNYWIASPAVFDDYCGNYLWPIMQWLKKGESKELRKQMDIPVIHRDKPYSVSVFFLEAIFQCYVHYKKIPYAYIFNKELEDKYGLDLLNDELATDESIEEHQKQAAERQWRKEVLNCFRHYNIVK